MLLTPHDHATAEDVPVQRALSRRQKWDLGLLFAAGLLSTALFTVPLLLPPPQSASVQSEPIAAGGPVQPVQNVQIVTALHEVVVTVPEVREASADQRRSGARRVARAPEWRPIVVARANTPLGRKLGRLVAGDGRYVVRPFPTVDQEQR